MYVSIIRPLGYEPNALPLRQFARHIRPHCHKNRPGRSQNKKLWRIRVSIPVLNLAKVVCYHVQQSPELHPSGLEPEPTPWKGVILPLN